MPTRTVTIASASGLHARPAALFVAAAAAQPVPVTIRTGTRQPVPARSMLSVLSLGAGCGTKVILEADGDGADAALDALAALLATDLDADESGGKTAPGAGSAGSGGSSDLDRPVLETAGPGAAGAGGIPGETAVSDD